MEDLTAFAPAAADPAGPVPWGAAAGLRAVYGPGAQLHGPAGDPF